MVIFISLPSIAQNSAAKDSARKAVELKQAMDEAFQYGLSGIPLIEKIPVPIRGNFPSDTLLTNIRGNGAIWVRMLVDRHGKVLAVQIQKSTTDVLNQSCLDAARIWTFHPAIGNRKPVALWISMPFRYRDGVWIRS